MCAPTVGVCSQDKVCLSGDGIRVVANPECVYSGPVASSCPNYASLRVRACACVQWG